jgi:SAM-dependent methyltransferase
MSLSKLTHICSDKWITSNQEKILADMSYDLSGKYLLDVGCGQGNFIKMFLNSEHERTLIVGVDITVESLREAKAKFRAESVAFMVADVRYLPFRCKSFDLTYCKDVMHHAEDKKFLDHLIFTSNRVIVVEASRDNRLNMIYTRINHDDHLRTEELIKIIKKSKFNSFKLIQIFAYPANYVFSRSPRLSIFSLSAVFLSNALPRCILKCCINALRLIDSKPSFNCLEILS